MCNSTVANVGQKRRTLIPRFCVKNYINAGLSDNVRAVIIRRSRMRPRR